MGSAFDDFDLQRRSTGQLLRPLAHQRNRVDLRQYQVSALLAKREEEERTISPVPWQTRIGHLIDPSCSLLRLSRSRRHL